MDTRDVVLVDAFTAEPTGGVPVAVLPDGSDLTDNQVRAVARELETPATAVPTDGPPDALRAVGPRGPVDPHAVAVGAIGAATERGWIDCGTHPVTVEGDPRSVPTDGDTLDVTATADGRVWNSLAEPHPEPTDIELESVADALGVPLAALRDVGADLPPIRVSAGVDALAVPVNFLEHLGSAAPDPVALADLTAAVDVEAVCAFTFDTLGADATCHARTFGDWNPGTRPPYARTVGLEAPVTPAVWAGTAISLHREAVVGDDEPVVEGGHYLDRPGWVRVDPDELRVGGRAVPTLDGTVGVPPSGDEEILEA